MGEGAALHSQSGQDLQASVDVGLPRCSYQHRRPHAMTKPASERLSLTCFLVMACKPIHN